MTEQRVVMTPEGAITYFLTIKKVKNLNLRVRADGTVTVSANREVLKKRVDEFVQDHERWIAEHLARLNRGVTHPFLTEYCQGEPFTLQGETVALWALPGADRETRKRALRREIDKLCRSAFADALARVYPLVEDLHVGKPELRIRRMTSRWGSCHVQKGLIVLSTALIATPKACLDYVMLHELIHFLHPNHGGEFYGVLSALMPDWKARRKELEGFSRTMDTL